MLKLGLYDELITERLAAELRHLQPTGLVPVFGQIIGEVHDYLGGSPILPFYIQRCRASMQT